MRPTNVIAGEEVGVPFAVLQMVSLRSQILQCERRTDLQELQPYLERKKEKKVANRRDRDKKKKKQ